MNLFITLICCFYVSLIQSNFKDDFAGLWDWKFYVTFPMYGIAEGNAMHSSDPAVHEQRLQPSSGKNTPNHIGAKQKSPSERD